MKSTENEAKLKSRGTSGNRQTDRQTNKHTDGWGAAQISLKRET